MLHVQDIGSVDSAMDRMNLSVHYCSFQCPVQRTKDVTMRRLHAHTTTNVYMGEVEQNDVFRLIPVLPFSFPRIFLLFPDVLTFSHNKSSIAITAGGIHSNSCFTFRRRTNPISIFIVGQTISDTPTESLSRQQQQQPRPLPQNMKLAVENWKSKEI